MTPAEAIYTGDTTLPKLLRHWARVQPSRLAMRDKDLGVWRRITWGDYYDNVRRLALGLRALGFDRGDRLSVASEDTPEWMYADLATQVLGGICFGVYPTNPWPELKYMLAHSKGKVVVCGDQEQTDKVLDALSDGDGLPDLEHIICVDMKGMRKYDHPKLKSFEAVLAIGDRQADPATDVIEQAIETTDPDDVAIMVYTSGTTGMPKGAMLSHRNIIYSAAQQKRQMGITRDNFSVLCYLPLCHVAERLVSSVMQLTNGSDVNFAESIDTVAVNLREIAPRGFLGVPRIWEKLQQNILIRLKDSSRFQQRVVAACMAIGTPIARRRLDNGGSFASLGDRLTYLMLWLACFRSLQRYLGLSRAWLCMCGGATVSPEVLLYFWTIGIRIYQIYGATELGGITHSQKPGATRLGWSGPPLAGLETRVDEDGELLIRGPSIFKGYLFDEAATAQTMEDGWYRTGDIVDLDERTGEIKIVDRKKEIIITSGGKNITPSLIENALKDSVYIREAILIGEGRNFLSALVQIDYDTVGKWAQEKGFTYTTYKSLAERPEVHDLVEAEVDRVNAKFARVENIRKFVILAKELDHDDGELTATMKVRRRVIETKFSDEIGMIYGGAG
jgi:long-chain acyl-CoA synthetase